MTIRETGREEIEIVLSLEEAEAIFERCRWHLGHVEINDLFHALRREKELVDGLDDVDAGAV